MFKFIHTADIHLDSPLRGLEAYEDAPVEEIRGATRRAFVNLVDYAIAEQVVFLLISGDLYDGNWKDYNSGIFFAHQMGRLQSANIKVVIISGNHDAASQISKSLSMPDNVTVLFNKKPQSITIEELGVIIHGQSYATRAVNENLVMQYPQADSNYVNIGMLHTSLNGREGHENYAPCSVNDLQAKGYDYWALGHVHQREIIAEDPWIVFPGNLQGRHCREIGSKGATLVTIDAGNIIEVEHIEFDVLRWAVCQVDISGCNTTGDVYQQIRVAVEHAEAEADQKTLALRLVLVGVCSLHNDLHARERQWLEEIHSVVASFQGVWLEKVKIKTKPEADIAKLLNEDTPVASLLRTIADLSKHEQDLTTMLPELAELTTKLPADLQGMPLLNDSKSYLTNEVLPDVQELLVARLMDQGGE